MSKTALIVVDMIHDFTHPNGKVFYPQNELVIPRLDDFITFCKASDIDVIFIEHTINYEDFLNQKKKMRECCIEGSGGELTDARLHCDRQSDTIIKKTKYSAFFQTELEDVLKDRNIDSLIITGTKTNNCVLATTFDAYSRDYNTYVVSDLVATNSTELNQIYLNDINKYLAQVKTTQEMKNLIKVGDL